MMTAGFIDTGRLLGDVAGTARPDAPTPELAPPRIIAQPGAPFLRATAAPAARPSPSHDQSGSAAFKVLKVMQPARKGGKRLAYQQSAFGKWQPSTKVAVAGPTYHNVRRPTEAGLLSRRQPRMVRYCTIASTAIGTLAAESDERSP